MIERFEQYLSFIERIDSPWVGLNFDIGHAYCVGEDPQNWVAKMAGPHAALSPRRHRRHARPPAPDPGPRRDRLPGHARGHRKDRLRRLAHGRALSLHRRPRRRRPRSQAVSRTAAHQAIGWHAQQWAWRLMKTRWRAYFELLRFPAVFTAFADVMMGYLVTQGSFQPPWVVALLIVASSLIYLAGMVLNDVHDADVDAVERPKRRSRADAFRLLRPSGSGGACSRAA